ncbi:MAG: hypothetical protein HZA77_07110 [Candidatus Schekmanbacteria bacterium]|nr:hypothetical protein [Candidatus Schekmanbacteria bacterium]
MKHRSLVVAVLLVVFCLTSAGIHAADPSYRYKPAKPFAGKFKGTIDPYTIVYTITQKGSDISGSIQTLLDGTNVLPLTFTGTIGVSGKTADINLIGTQSLTTSDTVKIKLIEKGKKFIKMQYRDDDTGDPIGDYVKYKRVK